MLEKTPCENFCQKGPAVGGGTPGPGDTWHVSPGPLPAGPCRRWHRRHVAWRGGSWHAWQHAATPIGGRQHAATPPGGRWQGRGHGRAGAMPPPPLAAATSPGRTEADVPAMPTAARACRHWPRRHVQCVAWPGGAATHSRSILTKIFAGGLF
jgi:hypothetical protein